MFQRKALIFALCIAALSDATITRALWPQGFAYDFAVFWRTVHGPISQIYADSPDPFVYPPTGLLWFQLLRLAPFWPSFIAWSLLSFAVFWFAAARLFGRAPAWLAAASPAVVLGLIPGQTSLLASAGLLAAYSVRSPLWRGVLLGLTVTLKPQLVLLAPLVLLVQGELVAVAAMTLVAGAVAAFATALFGAGIWAAWMQSIPHFQQVLVERHLSLSAVSPASYAQQLGIPAMLALAGGVLAGLLIALRSKELGPGGTATAIAAASLLSAPYALRYDLVALMPLVAGTILAESDRRGFVASLAYSAILGPLSIVAALPSLFQKARGRVSSALSPS
ncbi:MAG: glycosyltransferase family 87 protein [Sphingomicrobium sp.]